MTPGQARLQRALDRLSVEKGDREPAELGVIEIAKTNTAVEGLMEKGSQSMRLKIRKTAKQAKIVDLAKRAAMGEPTPLTRVDFYNELAKRAARRRRPEETEEQAFHRYATSSPKGKALMTAAIHAQAHGNMPPVADTRPMGETSPAYQRLMEKATEMRRDDPKLTAEQAFERAYQHNPVLAAENKSWHSQRIMKAAGGR